MVDTGQYIWRDGAIVDASTGSQTSLLAHTLHYGVGAFEGIRAYRRAAGDTIVFRLQEHVDRLFASCRLALMKPEVTPEQLHDGVLELLRRNEMSEAYIRPLCLYDDGSMGILPVENRVVSVVIAWKWGTYLGADGLEKGIRCKISPWSRHHIKVAFAKAKLCGQYINSVMAKQDAKLSGFDEALLADVHGHVCEGSGENIFLVRGGTLVTPPLSASILAGITRDTVITLAREEGIAVQEAPITRDELYLADEVFLTGTAAEVTPVREIDFRTIGAGARGPITERLQQRYFDVVAGRDESHPEWLARL